MTKIGSKDFLLPEYHQMLKSYLFSRRFIVKINNRPSEVYLDNTCRGALGKRSGYLSIICSLLIFLLVLYHCYFCLSAISINLQNDFNLIETWTKTCLWHNCQWEQIISCYFFPNKDSCPEVHFYGKQIGPQTHLEAPHMYQNEIQSPGTFLSPNA